MRLDVIPQSGDHFSSRALSDIENSVEGWGESISFGHVVEMEEDADAYRCITPPAEDEAVLGRRISRSDPLGRRYRV